MKKRNIHIVLDLGFGDSGKGKTVDWLAKNIIESGEDEPLVVRFSGGQQCGHTVINDNGKHIHASFPSGALSGHWGYITKDCVISPLHMFNEWMVLKDKVNYDKPRLTVHPLTPVTTPFEIDINHISEKINNHGSCGMGVGATMKREEQTPFHFYAQDLMNDIVFKHKLCQLQKYYNDTGYSGNNIDGNSLCDFIIASKWFRENIKVADEKQMGSYKNIIFEGSQGIMLDQKFGFFPHVTYANTTSENAWQYINSDDKVTKHYVTRAYATRHGNGPFVEGEGNISLTNTEEEINVSNKFQGDFRIAPLDTKLLDHAKLCDESVGKITASKLYVNCCDQISDDLLKKTLDNIDKNLRLRTYKSFTPKTHYET